MIVYTYVVCDLLHIGHLNLFRQARKLGDYLIVGVTSDDGVEAYKRRPVQSFEERSEIVRELRMVDRVVM